MSNDNGSAVETPVASPEFLHEALTALHTDQAGWDTLVSDLFADVERLLQELQQAEGQLADERNTLEKTQVELERHLQATQSVEELGQSLHAEIHSLEEQRETLVHALEAERQRSTELESHLAACEQELEHERGQMKHELQRVMQLLQGRPESPIRTAAKPRPESSAAQSGADPVLDNVMAQFEQLHRDAQHRRPTT